MRRILAVVGCLSFLQSPRYGFVRGFKARPHGRSPTSVTGQLRVSRAPTDNLIDDNSEKTVVIAGATGYIGRAVVEESVKRGYNTIALVRNKTRLETLEGRMAYGDSFQGAHIQECDVENRKEVNSVLESCTFPVEAVVSCLASPLGTKKEAYAIDYQATLNCLRDGQHVDAKHFVMLSAFCCRNPLLQLQQAKLKFEAELQAQDDLSYTIVRPTAFLKSISGQLESIKNGAPYVLFGDGAVTRCNPIAESELAEFMLDSLVNEEKRNQILNVGGPDQPLTNQMLGEMMFKAVGMEPKFVYAPTWIFDSIIQTLQVMATLSGSEQLEDAVETGKIGKYYAVEDMLTTDPTEKYGTITVQQHYNKIAAQGQDRFTPIRATAFIGRALEVFPLVPFALAGMWAMMNARQVEQAASGPQLSLLLSSASQGVSTFFHVGP